MNGGRIFRFPNLAAVRAHLHAGGYRYLEDLSDEERRRTGGLAQQPLGVTRAALNSGVRDREEVFRAAGCPPKVFVSYRWESPEVVRWAERLSRHLESRGYQVLLDQDVEALRDNDPVEIGRYISGIVECSFVVCVMTPQYEAGMGPRAWLFEERQLMNLLARRGAVIVRLRVDGAPPEQPGRRPFDVSVGASVEVQVEDHYGVRVDMRGVSRERFDLLDPVFRYTGPRFPAEADRPFRAWLDTVARAWDERDTATAAAAYAQGVAAYGAAPESRRLGAHLAYAHGDTAEATRLATEVAADEDASPETLLDIALLLADLGRPHTALRALGRLPSWLGAEWSWLVHFHQGNLLDDVGSPVAALAHLRYALALAETVTIEPRPKSTQLANLHNVIGYVLLFGFGSVDAAYPHLDAAWHGLANPANGVNLILCHAAMGDYDAADRLWRTLEPMMTSAERERFAEIPAGIAARHLGRLDPQAPPPGSGPDWWRCPGCDTHLVMAESTTLCASCATAFRGARCPCCGSQDIAGAGRAVTGTDRPPRCPICNVGTSMDPVQNTRQIAARAW